MNTPTTKPPMILPPHYLVASLAVMAGLRFWLDGAAVLSHTTAMFGLLPLLVGLALAARGAFQFKTAGTNITPLSESSALVTAGVFGYTRNPMYLGMLLLLTGTALLLNRAWPWLVIPAFGLIIRIAFIAREESLMQATFGDTYSDYCKQVRRWL
jgi:protein-S-isoprenylcysteine O-methyltransferase Ste14